MAIKMIAVECPRCGAQLDVEEDREYAFCSYCGTKILIENDNEYTYRHIDEARVYEAKTDRYVRMEQLKRDNRDDERDNDLKRIKIIGMIALIAVGAILMVLASLLDNDGLGTTGLLLVTGAAWIGLFMYIDKDSKKKRTEPVRGGVQLPDSLENWDSMSYTAVRELLQESGFTNIKCIAMGDLDRIGRIRPGRVDSITFGGKSYEDCDDDDSFRPDVRIIIMYHSMAQDY